MLISTLAALVMFAAPEQAQSGEAAKLAAEGAAKPEMRRVCVTMPAVSGSNLPKKKCRMEPVRAATKPGEGGDSAPAKGQTKPE